MPLSVGEALGPYEITAPIGKGGMGEVWKAHDPRLSRDVAIKVSAAQFSERFEREAKAIAALNHPNICQIYDVGPDYLVMEYVQGAPLKGPLPVDRALEYASQICGALDAAHKKGITHRDLKPANILLTKQGIKLLDFGLAKFASTLTGQAPKSPDDATLTMALTGKNEIVGSLYYMSPEQLEAQATGQEIDARSDIFSFGLVLYEMLTGKRAFEGSSPASVIAAIMERPAPSIVDVAPAALDRVLRKCLAKDPDERWQTSRDLKDELVWIARLSGESTPVPTAVARHSVWPWIAAAALAIAVGFGWLYLNQPKETSRLTRTSLVMPDKASYDDYRSLPAISPDGRRIAISLTVEGKRSIWLRDLDSLEARPLPGTDEGYLPFWSPDSRQLGYFTPTTVKKIDAGGGPSLTVCDAASGAGGTWNQNDVIVYAVNAGGLFRVSASGGMSSPIVEPDRAAGESSDRGPWFLPDGVHLLYTARSVTNPEKSRVRVVDVNATPTSKAKTNVIAVDSNAVYAPPGLLLYMRETTLVAQPFDAGKAQTAGDAVPIAEQVNFASRVSQGSFSVSGNGALVYASAAMGAPDDDARLLWFDRTGKSSGTLTMPLNPYLGGWARIAPGGQAIALSARDGQARGMDIWLHDLARGATSRLTFGPGSGRFPVWSPDGGQLAFEMMRPESKDMYKKAVSGVGQMEIVSQTQADHYPNDWSPDGRYVIEQRRVLKHGWDVWIVPMIGNEKAFPYLQTEFNETNARLSPNGQWLAYQSDESKRDEIYVVGFPKPVGRLQISSGGGTVPVWSRDGRELYFLSADRKLTAVSMGTGTKFEPGIPKPLFETRAVFYDVSKDGRFLMTVPSEQTASSVPLTAVFNWQAALKKP